MKIHLEYLLGKAYRSQVKYKLKRHMLLKAVGFQI